MLVIKLKDTCHDFASLLLRRLGRKGNAAVGHLALKSPFFKFNSNFAPENRPFQAPQGSRIVFQPSINLGASCENLGVYDLVIMRIIQFIHPDHTGKILCS